MAYTQGPQGKSEARSPSRRREKTKSIETYRFPGSSDPVEVGHTAKRLRNSAQGCRASRLPWGKRVERCNPDGVVSLNSRSGGHSIDHCRHRVVRFAQGTQPQLGLRSFRKLDPRVAAEQRGNPGLSYTTASRLEEESNQSILR